MHCQLIGSPLLCRAAFSAAATLLAVTPAAAQTSATGGLEISGSFRVRGDAIDGQFRPGKAENDAIMMLRTTLKASYTAGPVQVLGELVDARAYGQDLTTPIGTSEVNAIEPLQAYVGLDLGQIIGQGFNGNLKAGRFTMAVGSSRLVGTAGDSNFPAAYTGAALDISTPGHGRVQLFWTMPNIRLPGSAEALQNNEVRLDRATTDVQFYGVHYSRPLIGAVDGEAYAFRLTEKDSPGYQTANRDLLTYGARIFRMPEVGSMDFDLEYARQSGETRATSSAADMAELDVDAYFFHAEIGRKMPGNWNARVSAHFDIASGDGPGSRYGRFDPLFGIRRGEFGPTSIYGPIRRSNLISPGVRLETKRGKRFDAMTMYRALWLRKEADTFAATGVRDAAGTSGKWAGNQVELRLRYWLAPGRLQLEGGGAYLDKGRFLREAPNAPATGDTRYGYVSLLATF